MLMYAHLDPLKKSHSCLRFSAHLIKVMSLLCLIACEESPSPTPGDGGETAGDLSGVEGGGAGVTGGFNAGGESAGAIAGEIAGEVAGEIAGEMVNPLDPLSTWAMIDFGWEHGCGLDASGYTWCWGLADQGQSSPPSLTGVTVSRLSTGKAHTCAEGMSDQASVISCWGRGVEGQLDPPSDFGELHHVSAGWRETCALDNDGHPRCWGEVDPLATPSVDLSLSVIELGQGFGCGLIREGGSITCWGRDGYGQATPPSGEGYQRLSVGSGRHACALNAEGRARCWGDSADGRTLAPALTFTQLSVGRDHTCALTPTQEVSCWGVNLRGQTDAPSGSFEWVVAGPSFTCGLRAEGSLSCWGSLSFEAAPLFQHVAAGAAHSCAVKADQSLSCWGWPRAGREQPPEGVFNQVAVGVNHACALRDEGSVSCWGVGVDPNRFERDGDYDQASPPPSLAEGSVTQVAVGDAHSCALNLSGEVICWGDDRQGQATPPRFSSPVVSLALGAQHSCALQEGGSVLCWGSDQSDQLTAPLEQPFSQIRAGGDLSCGITAEGEVRCWGAVDSVTIPNGEVRHLEISARLFCVQEVEADEVECQIKHSRVNLPDPPQTFTLLAPRAQHLSAGVAEACALRADERLVCQGDLHPSGRPLILPSAPPSE